MRGVSKGKQKKKKQKRKECAIFRCLREAEVSRERSKIIVGEKCIDCCASLFSCSLNWEEEGEGRGGGGGVSEFGKSHQHLLASLLLAEVTQNTAFIEYVLPSYWTASFSGSIVITWKSGKMWPNERDRIYHDSNEVLLQMEESFATVNETVLSRIKTD